MAEMTGYSRTVEGALSFLELDMLIAVAIDQMDEKKVRLLVLE